MNNKNKYTCECKGVPVWEIRRAIRNGGAESLLDLQSMTKAATGCGRCKNLVISILNTEIKEKKSQGKQLKLDL